MEQLSVAQELAFNLLVERIQELHRNGHFRCTLCGSRHHIQLQFWEIQGCALPDYLIGICSRCRMTTTPDDPAIRGQIDNIIRMNGGSLLRFDDPLGPLVPLGPARRTRAQDSIGTINSCCLLASPLPWVTR